MKDGTLITFDCFSYPYGLSYIEWTIRWWKWLMAFPKPCNPAFDQSGSDCAKNQSDKNVWFLAGTVMPVLSAKRSCAIPHGRAILFPVINNLISYLEYPDLETDDQLKALARKDYKLGIEMLLTIDDWILSHEICRIDSNPFEIEYPNDNIFDTRPGVSRAVSDGFWIFLAPLSKGIHSIYFSAKDLNYQTNVSYAIQIE